MRADIECYQNTKDPAVIIAVHKESKTTVQIPREDLQDCFNEEDVEALVVERLEKKMQERLIKG